MQATGGVDTTIINKEELRRMLEGFVDKILEAKGRKDTAPLKTSARGADAGLEEHQLPSHTTKVQHQVNFVDDVSSIEGSFVKMRRDGVQYQNDEWEEVRDFFVNHKLHDLLWFYSTGDHQYLWDLFRKRPPKDIVKSILEHWPVDHKFPTINNCVDADSA